MKKIILAALMALTVMALAACQPANSVRQDAVKLSGTQAELKAFKLTIPAADCASTAGMAGTLLDDIDGVSDTYVDMDSTTAEIKVDLSKTSIEAIKKVMADGEYPVTKVEEMQ